VPNGLSRTLASCGAVRPGLDQPPGCGDEDRDMSATPGVPGMLGRASPRERPERPLVVPSLPRASAVLARWMLGGCWAAEERRRRWPAAVAAEKDGWGASVKLRGRRGSECAECSCAACDGRGEGTHGSPGPWAFWGRVERVDVGRLRPAGGQVLLPPTAARGGCTGAGRELRGQCGATSEAIGVNGTGPDGQWQPSVTGACEEAFWRAKRRAVGEAEAEGKMGASSPLLGVYRRVDRQWLVPTSKESGERGWMDGWISSLRC